VPWETLRTHLHELQIARVRLSPRGAPAIWALENIGDILIFATRLGQFGYLDADNHLGTIDLQVPMGLEALRRSGLYDDPVFQIDQVRVLDLLSAQTGPNTYDLFVSHHRYVERCFQQVVSRIRLVVDNGAVRAAPDSGWEDIYVARPCIEIKHTRMRFAGMESGGRLARPNPNTLLLSVGGYELDDVDGAGSPSMDPDSDLGKLIEIDIATGARRLYSMGLRNPQGLLIDSAGRVWESEHGPQGGDEVNLMRRGVNYGWPVVTYGMQYGATPWPFSDHQGQHLGYERPRFSFVPSIGISNLIEPNADEFPNWSEHLLVGSLSGATLFALKLEGEDIVYAEAIALGARLRDLVTMTDGRIAIVTDGGGLFLIRNAERHRDAPGALTMSGFTSLPPPLPEDELPNDKRVAGARVFHYGCGSCHTITGEIHVGPPLNGVIGREIGAVEGFPYSSALEAADGRWTPGRMRAFLNHEDRRLAGTSMPAIPLYDDQFDALIAYLRTTRAGPAQHPSPQAAE
jgi:cytochrome c2